MMALITAANHAADTSTSPLVWVILVGGIGLGIYRVYRSVVDGTGGKCPSCGKLIKSGQHVCHHCGRDNRQPTK